MIENFQHKGLQKFFLSGSLSGISPDHAKRLRLILFKIHTASTLADLNFPGSNLHLLKGKLKDFQSIQITGNWRVIFRFEEGNAFDVDYLDYH